MDVLFFISVMNINKCGVVVVVVGFEVGFMDSSFVKFWGIVFICRVCMINL